MPDNGLWVEQCRAILSAKQPLEPRTVSILQQVRMLMLQGHACNHLFHTFLHSYCTALFRMLISPCMIYMVMSNDTGVMRELSALDWDKQRAMCL